MQFSTKLEICRQIFVDFPSNSFSKKRFTVRLVVTGRTDKHGDVNIHIFSLFCESAKNKYTQALK